MTTNLSAISRLPSKQNKDYAVVGKHQQEEEEKHTYAFPLETKITPEVKALLDYWSFIDLMEYQGGSENFSEIHREMVSFITQIQTTQCRLEDMAFRRLMLIPRGHLKTTLVVGYVLWRVYRNPNIRILVATATKDLALQIVKLCKQLFENEYLQNKLWNNRPHISGSLVPMMDRGQTYRRRRSQSIADLIEDNTETEAEDKKIVWRADAIQVVRSRSLKEPTIQATSPGSNITGMHFDLIIMDDIINDDTTATSEKMEKTLEWARDVESILDPPQSVICGHLGKYVFREYVGDEKIVIGTRYAKGDYYEYLESKKDELGYKVFSKNVYVNGVDDADGFIFPEKFNKLYIERLKTRLQARRFGSQYLNTIISSEEQVFEASNIVYFSSQKVERQNRHVRVTMGTGEGVDIFPYIVIDPAISKKKTADFSVILVGGMDYQRNLYILDFVCARFTPDELVSNIFSVADKWDLRNVHLEVVVFQQALVYMIKQKFTDYRPIAISEYRPKGDKKTRIETHLQPLLANKKVFMAEWMSTHNELMQQLHYFPSPTAHDDILDAMAMLCEVCVPTRDNKSRKAMNAHNRYVNAKYGGLY